MFETIFVTLAIAAHLFTGTPSQPVATLFEDGSYQIENATGTHTGCVQDAICDEDDLDSLIVTDASYTEYTTENGHFVWGFNIEGYYSDEQLSLTGYHLCSDTNGDGVNVCETFVRTK